MKSVVLVARAIRNSSEARDIVFEPFPAAIAARRTIAGRRLADPISGTRARALQQLVLARQLCAKVKPRLIAKLTGTTMPI